MKKRRPPVVFAQPRSNDPSQQADYQFFRNNPACREYERPYIAGESPEPMPPGTMVVVRRVGHAQRVRAFMPPQAGRN